MLIGNKFYVIKYPFTFKQNSLILIIFIEINVKFDFYVLKP